MTFALGITAALVAPLVMTVGFMVWENHWSKTGSAFALNLFKCNLATVGFAILVLATNRSTDSNELFENWKAQTVGYLLLSSTIGILIGDWTWLQGLKLLGAKRVILMDSFKPFLAAFLGWMILEEELRLTALSGIVLTMLGVVLVSWERTTCEDKEEAEAAAIVTETVVQEETATQLVNTNHDSNTMNDDTAELSEFADKVVEQEDLPRETKHETLSSCTSTKESSSSSSNNKKTQHYNKLWYGYAMSILNVGLDTYGAVLIKEHGTELSVWEINLIRFGFAGVVMLFLSLLLHTWSWWRRRRMSSEDEDVPKNERVGTKEAQHDEDKQDIPSKASTPWYSLPELSLLSWCHVSGGVLLVTFLTPTLSNYALFQIALALALTLGSVGPLYALVLGYCMQGNILTFRAVLGAMLAVTGIVVLAFCGNLPEENLEGEALLRF